MGDEEYTAALEALGEADRLYDLGKYDECLHAIEAARDKYGDVLTSDTFLSRLGLCHYDMRRADEAIEELSQVRQIYESEEKDLAYAKSMYYLGLAYAYIDDTQRRVEVLLDVEKHLHFFDNAEYHSGYCHCLRLLGMGLLSMGDGQGAIERLDRASEYATAKGKLPEESRMISLDLARAHLVVGNHNDVLSVLQRLAVVDLDLDDKLRYYRIKERACGHLEMHNEVLDAFETLIALDCDELFLAEVYHWAGRAHYYMRQNREAADCFKMSDEHITSPSWITEHNGLYLGKLKDAGFE